MQGKREEFDRLGFSIERGLLTSGECRAVLAYEKKEFDVAPEPWAKARAAIDPFYYRLGADERFLARLRPLLGEDIVLWGADLLLRSPGVVHPWHCDIESCGEDGGFVSIWIGLSHTNRKSALNLVAGSHKFGTTIQEQAHIHGLRRGEGTDADVVAWARSLDPAATLVAPKVGNGDAILFDGRLWHGSRNTRRYFSRTAILLQYARADRAVRMFDPAHLEWPLRTRQDVLPPVVVISGRAPEGLNAIVEAPLAS